LILSYTDKLSLSTEIFPSSFLVCSIAKLELIVPSTMSKGWFLPLIFYLGGLEGTISLLETESFDVN